MDYIAEPLRSLAVPIAELHEDPSNARKGHAVERIAASLKQYGQRKPIVVNRAQGGKVEAGNGTLAAAKSLGWTHIAAVFVDDDAATAAAYGIADNRVGEFSEWDADILGDLIPTLDGLFTGFDAAELEALVPDMTGADSVERASLADRFLVPPFSVLDARQGYWQARKSAWLALGIQSELGRGITEDSQNDSSDYGLYDPQIGKRANATPGGSPRPAATLVDGHTVRGDGVGRRIKGKLPADSGGQPMPLDRMANGKSPARKFAQDLMKGEHVVGGRGDSRAIKDHDWQVAHLARPQARIQPGGSRLEAANLDPITNKFERGDLHTGVEASQASGTSIFDPVLCELAYTWFSPPGGIVLDPFAGGSVRGIVAARLGRMYTGVDLSAQQVAANVVQGAAIVPDNVPTWIVGDSVTDQPDMQADFVFSCPPYADLEIYSDDPRDISQMDFISFLGAYRTIIAQAVARLKDDRFACFVIGDVRDKGGIYRNLVSETIAAFEATGARLYNEAILVTAVGSLPIRVGKQFAGGRKLGKTHQNVLVFIKGDWRKAVQACGPVEVALPQELLP
jgi:DNA modification methylase